MHGGYVYYGGTIGTNDPPNSACGVRRVARASTATGALDTTWNPPVGGPANGTASAGVAQRVHSIAFDDDHVYLGGEFTQMPDGITAMTQPRLARVALADNETGQLDPDFAPRPNGTVSALAVGGAKLYAGGGFTQLAGAPEPSQYAGLARMSTTTPVEYDAGWLPAPNGVVEALLLDGDELALGGAFTALAGLSTAGYAEVGTGLGTLRVVNELDPPSNSGKFNLQIHGVSYKENATDGEDTGVQTVYAGTNTVGETAGTRTSPADYVTSIECVDAADNVVASGTGAGPLDVEVADGEDVVCTITNRYQVATELSVTGLPGTATAGSTQSPTITVRDQNGDVFDRYRGTVEITSTDPQADLPADYTFTAVDDGSHTFTNAVSLKTTGDQTLTATDTANTSLTDTE